MHLYNAIQINKHHEQLQYICGEKRHCASIFLCKLLMTVKTYYRHPRIYLSTPQCCANITTIPHIRFNISLHFRTYILHIYVGVYTLYVWLRNETCAFLDNRHNILSYMCCRLGAWCAVVRINIWNRFAEGNRCEVNWIICKLIAINT